MQLVSRLVERLKELDRDRESGAAMVEFVVVFPIQLTLTLLIMQFALLANAHLIVQQAAFMGARAAAVSDGMVDDGAVPDLAAQRIAARTLSVLTTPRAATGGAGVIPGGGGLPTRLDWAGKRGTLSAARTSQAYGHLEVEVAHSQHLVRCKVQYDYVLSVPVASTILSRKAPQLSFLFQTAGDYNDATIERGVRCFRITRIGYIPTPWIEEGLTGGTTTVAIGDTGNK